MENDISAWWIISHQQRNWIKELADAGVRFQPLVYTNAVCEQSETEPAAMLYLQMNDPIIDESKAATDEAF